MGAGGWVIHAASLILIDTVGSSTTLPQREARTVVAVGAGECVIYAASLILIDTMGWGRISTTLPHREARTVVALGAGGCVIQLLHPS